MFILVNLQYPYLNISKPAMQRHSFEAPFLSLWGLKL